MRRTRRRPIAVGVVALTIGVGVGSGSSSPVARPGAGAGAGPHAPRAISAAGTIDIEPPTIILSAAQGTTIQYEVPVSDRMMLANGIVTAVISGTGASAFTIVEPGCTGPACAFSPAVPTPASLTITCTPDGTTRSGVLAVEGQNGAADTDSAAIACSTATTGGPRITVVPSQLGPVTSTIGTPSAPQPLTIRNDGDQDLTAQITSSDPDWVASACTSAPCTILPAMELPIEVVFTPSAFGADNAQLTIASNAGMTPAVPLLGSGSGAWLDVVAPSDFRLDFNTIALDQRVPLNVELAATGPDGVTVTIEEPAPPYALSSNLLVLGPGGTATLEVACQASSPGGPNVQTIAITSTAQAQNTMSLELTCSIANTSVLVTPTSYDFGELRIGEPRKTIPFTMTNHGAAVDLSYVRLSESRPNLTLTFASADLGTLEQDASVSGELALTSASEVELAGVSLEIGIDGQELAYNVLGKVVRPLGTVTPTALDLGTACIGSQVAGTITMHNDGTATLHPDRPQMDASSFVATPIAPASYPADLLPGSLATVEVRPSTSTAGMVSSRLGWNVDAPGAPFTVPVQLTFIESGTGVSPNQLAFGVLDVGTTSAQQQVTLQNCDTVNTVIRVLGVRASQGSIRAWNLTPDHLEQELGPNGKLTISVRFEPTEPGRHHAELQVEVDGELRLIALDGTAVGANREQLSFYACSCAGPGAPARGWPVVLAIAAILRRRRRSLTRPYPTGSA